jgi:hypothetical protein
MSLSPDSKKFVGQLVMVLPEHGWGWSRRDVAGHATEILAPASFRMKIVSLFEDEGRLRGGVGKIENSNECFGGWSVVFSTRHEGDFDFSVQIPHCNISIGPTIDEGDWPTACGAGSCFGYGRVEAIK